MPRKPLSKKMQLYMDKLDEVEKAIRQDLARYRRKYTAKKYREWLEDMYIAARYNWDRCLDEVIALRERVNELTRR